jgi:hypothetical protein
LNKKYYLVREVLVQEDGRRRKHRKLKRLVRILAAVILAILVLPMCAFKAEVEAQSIPTIEDPTPGYYETSEYAMGSYAVGVIFVESNGAIDPNTENWTTIEQHNVFSKIQVACSNWTTENPNANLTFTFDIHYNVSTSYEPISRNITNRNLWISQVMANLGFPNAVPYETDAYLFQIRDYINALRNTQGTDWGFVIMVIDAANDEDGWSAFTEANREAIFLPVKTTNNLELIVGREMGHVFWASDEYNRLREYGGYLNVPDVDGSGCLMDTALTWNLSGKPYGISGTWGQVGWRDSNGNGVQDIVDTPQRIYLNPYKRIGNRLNFTGVAAVTPTENKNPSFESSKQNVTINVVKSVEYRVDNDEWLGASFVQTEVRKLMKYPDQYALKPTTAIVNFTFLTPELSLGQHFIEVRATDQWGISGYANTTVEVKPYLPTDLNQDGAVNIQDITIVAVAYGTRPGDPKWNVLADLDKSGLVNIIDMTMVAKDYGKTG